MHLFQHCHVHTAMARPSGWGLCLWCWQSGQMYSELREPGFLSAALPFTYQVASENYLMPSFRNYKTGLRGNIWGFGVNLSKPRPTRKAPRDLPPADHSLFTWFFPSSWPRSGTTAFSQFQQSHTLPSSLLTQCGFPHWSSAMLLSSPQPPAPTTRPATS